MTFEIEHRDNLSYAEFSTRYLYAKKPVVITDALREWKAVARWTPEFFATEFGSFTFTIDDELRSKVGHEDTRTPVKYTMARFVDRVFQSTVENPAPYFRNQKLCDLFPSLKEDIQPLPQYFLPNWLPEHYVVKPVAELLNRGAVIELYIGGKGGAFPVLHYDGAATHAFLMQIYGRKEFVIYPPDQGRFLYPSPEAPNLSLVKVDEPDLARFPLFANATPTTFVLEPGELLFVPSGWWHTTKMLTPSISVSINTANRSNWPQLVSYLASRRRNPVVSAASRAYLTGAGAWRSWRDRNWQPNGG